MLTRKRYLNRVIPLEKYLMINIFHKSSAFLLKFYRKYRLVEMADDLVIFSDMSIIIAGVIHPQNKIAIGKIEIISFCELILQKLIGFGGQHPCGRTCNIF